MAEGKATYFISDLHLEASRPHIAEAFLRFLDHQIDDAEALYILGDFFNVWIGDDDHSPFIERIKSALRACVARGIRVYFMHGNRDFLIGEGFARDTGVSILAEGSIASIHGESVLLLHGDNLCTADTRYQAFRRKVRNPAWQRKMLRYPLWLRRAIAAYMRARSKKMNSLAAEDILDVSPDAVVDALRQAGVSTMIHGHTHRPAHHRLSVDGEACERIVLGDWEASAKYLRVSDESCALLTYPISAA